MKWKWLCACKLQLQPGTLPLLLLTSPLTSARFPPAPGNLRFCTELCRGRANVRPITKNIPQDFEGPKFPFIVGEEQEEPGGPPPCTPRRAGRLGDTGGLGLGELYSKKPREVHGDMEGGLAGAVATPRVACLWWHLWCGECRDDAEKPGRWFPNLKRPACSFAFGIYEIGGFPELGGIQERQGARDWPWGDSFPFRCSSQSSHPERPLRCLPAPRGCVGGSRAPGPGPETAVLCYILSAPAALLGRIRWKTGFKEGKPYLNPGPSPLPSTFSHLSDLAPLSRDLGDQLA